MALQIEGETAKMCTTKSTQIKNKKHSIAKLTGVQWNHSEFIIEMLSMQYEKINKTTSHFNTPLELV